MTAFTIDLSPILSGGNSAHIVLTPEQFEQLCAANPEEYLNSGARLGWLLNPETQQVEIYRPDQTVEVLQSPATLSGEAVLPGFTLNLEWLWE